MMLNLNDNEREFLLNLLEERLGTLREQVYHSDTAAFRDALKAEEELLRNLLSQVRGEPPRAKAG